MMRENKVSIFLLNVPKCVQEKKYAEKAEKLKVDNQSVSVFCQEECLWSLPSHSVMTYNNQPIFH